MAPQVLAILPDMEGQIAEEKLPRSREIRMFKFTCGSTAKWFGPHWNTVREKTV